MEPQDIAYSANGEEICVVKSKEEKKDAKDEFYDLEKPKKIHKRNLSIEEKRNFAKLFKEENLKKLKKEEEEEEKNELIQKIIEENKKRHGKKKKIDDEERIRLASMEIKHKGYKFRRNEFQTLSSLGDGSFSQVYKVKCKTTNIDYALKIIPKRMLLDRRDRTEIVFTEKHCLLRLQHCRFVYNFVSSFQDKNYLYFVFEHVPNGELYYLLKYFEKVPEKLTKFFIAEIILALEYLDYKGIAHMDLKPENILLNSSFHIKLIDFGTAVDYEKKIKKGKLLCAGTPQYMCPEVIQNSSYKVVSKACDLWALGVILYQLLTGKLPFVSDSNFIIFNKIKSLDYEFPKDIGISTEAKDLIQKLLVLDPTERLGYKDFEELKEHEFFKGVNFDDVFLNDPPFQKELKEYEKKKKKEDKERDEGNRDYIQFVNMQRENEKIEADREYKIRKERERKRNLMRKKQGLLIQKKRSMKDHKKNNHERHTRE